MIKQYLSVCVFTLLTFTSFSQGSKDAQKLVADGIALNDRGDFSGALKKYDEALKIDPRYFVAAYEKTYTLYAADKKKECISLCKDLVKEFADHPNLYMVYIQYGSSLDDLGKSKDALDIYEEGIKKFPDQYLLHFNKGLTYQKLNRIDEALEKYQHSLKLRPLHSSSNYYTGLLLQRTNKVPALMAFATFLAVESKSERSADAIARVESIIGSNVKKDGNNVTIMLDPSMLDKSKKNEENNFKTTELIFTLSGALDNSKDVDSIAKTPADKLSLKLQLMINSLSEQIGKEKGFYWEHYVPFFVAMKEADQVGNLSHLMYERTGTEEDKDWLVTHESKIDGFYDWIKNYKWK